MRIADGRELVPIKDNVLLSLVPPPRKTVGGLLLPDPQFQTRATFRVEAVGPDAADALKPGDYVLLGKYSGTQFDDPTDPNKEYTIVPLDHVLGTLHP